MGNLRSINGRSIDGTSEHRRREPRTDLDLGLTVWGVDTRGDRFLQETRARDISLSGALLVGLDAELRSGDVIGILYAGKKARYRQEENDRGDSAQAGGAAAPVVGDGRSIRSAVQPQGDAGSQGQSQGSGIRFDKGFGFCEVCECAELG